MKYFIILLLFFGCGQQRNKLDDSTMIDNTDEDLYSLLDQLPILSTPLSYSSSNKILKLDLNVKRNELTYRISKFIPDLNVSGKIYQTEDFIAIICMIPEGNSIPVLMIYNKSGKEIDSFFMYPPSDNNKDYYSTNITTLNENKEIISIDSVLTLQVNKNGTRGITGTDLLRVTKKTFRIDEKGGSA